MIQTAMIRFFLPLFLTTICTALSSPLVNADDRTQSSLWGNWALEMPGSNAGWLTFSEKDGKPYGELWTVGEPKQLIDLAVVENSAHFKRRIRVGPAEYDGGPATGDRMLVPHHVQVHGDRVKVTLEVSLDGGKTKKISYPGKRLPPIPPKPALSKVRFGNPIVLFNGKNLNGWKLTNPKQINGWKVVDQQLVNSTPKLDFSAFSRYGNLRTTREFGDFNLKIEFKVPPKGNSGVYLRGMYEAQVLDRDSTMQGIQGVGAIFGRIKPTKNAGRLGGEWNRYDLTLVDRHITVILNGEKVIDNQPLLGCTKGALSADETKPGPIYLQGDHTAVAYRNIVLRPVVSNENNR